MTKNTQNCHNTKAIAVLKEKGEKWRVKIANSEYHPLQFTCGIPTTPQYGYMVCHGVPKSKTIPIPILNPNADFVGCLDTQQSTSGFVLSLCSGEISWSSRHHATVSMSTCKAEYIVSCHATKEALWLQKLIKLLGHPQDTTQIWNDNARSITLTKDPSFHACTKYIDIQ